MRNKTTLKKKKGQYKFTSVKENRRDVIGHEINEFGSRRIFDRNQRGKGGHIVKY